MHPLLVGGNPFTTTSIYGLILYLEKKWGIHYSMGGTGNIIKGFEKLMDEIEIEIIKNTEVTEIITKNNKITGVVVNNEEIIKADNVICNADPPAFYEKMTNKNKKLQCCLIGNKRGWITQWVYLFIILEQKKSMKTLNIIQLNLETNIKNI